MKGEGGVLNVPDVLGSNKGKLKSDRIFIAEKQAKAESAYY